MINPKYYLAFVPLISAALLGGGCVAGDVDTDTETVGEVQAKVITDFGVITANGTTTTFADVVNTGAGALDLTKTVGLTACDPKSLFAVTLDAGVYKLWYSSDSGLNWAQRFTGGPLRWEIACDHAVLATLDSNKDLWKAFIASDGTVLTDTAGNTFVKQTNTTKVDRIQGGDGSIYGVKLVTGGSNQLFVASGQSVNGALTWGNSIATIGATMVTGTGATLTGSDSQPVSDSHAWPRRAFALEVGGAVSTNKSILSGINTWAAYNTGNERYTVLTAAAPNILFGLQRYPGDVLHLNRITISEANCTDGIDNDANGMVDGDDPACTMIVAEAFCATRANGSYCGDRLTVPFQRAFFLNATNPDLETSENSSRVDCQPGHLSGPGHVTVTPGSCTHGSSAGLDFLSPASSREIPEPAGIGHWCNVHWDDGTWDLDWDSSSGSSPCDAMLLNPNKVGGEVVRAGVYSISGTNQVKAFCSDGNPGQSVANGSAPFQAVYNLVTHGTNACIFTITPTELPVFSKMFHSSHQVSGGTIRPITHSYFGSGGNGLPAQTNQLDLAWFGNGDTGFSKGIDRRGVDQGGQGEWAYDLPVDEGRPVLAVGPGIVIANGSRDRDISTSGSSGTANQGEIYVKYIVGSEAYEAYEESFVVYYAHVRKRLVVSGQTVKTGQILGYVGATGSANGAAHLHMSVHRLSNIPARTAANPRLGYRVPFEVSLPGTLSTWGMNMVTNAMDPLGWGAPAGADPWGHWYGDLVVTGIPSTATVSGTLGFTGMGAWSSNLFKSGQEFAYP